MIPGNDRRTVSGKKTVLVVEDSPTQAAQTRALLVANGLHVLIACDGLEGIQLAEEHLPSLIILDWEMPRMSGGEVLCTLKSKPQTHQIPIILFTHHDSPEIRAAGRQEGAVDLIPKDAFAKIVMLEILKQMGLISPSLLK